MATSNPPGVSGIDAGDNGFFSSITDFFHNVGTTAQGAGTLLGQVAPLWTRNNPSPTSNNNNPTFAGAAGANPSTGQVVAGNANLTPWLIGGGVILAVLVVVLVAKK